MSLQRYEPPVNEVITDDRYMDRLPEMAERFAKSNLCPEAFRGKPNDVAIIGYSLADLGLRLTINTLPHAYVVHGRIGIDSQLQVALASRYGYTIRPKYGACDNESATVEVIAPTGEMHEVTFTMADAQRGGLTKPAKSGEPSMYTKYPREMLIARAMTRGVKWHCPEVTLGMAGTANMYDIEQVEAAAPVGTESASTLESEPQEQSPEPALVTVAMAKNQLVEEFMNDYPRPRAKELAKALWEAHGYGNEPITADQLCELLTEAKAPEVEDAEVVEDGEPFTD